MITFSEETLKQFIINFRSIQCLKLPWNESVFTRQCGGKVVGFDIWIAIWNKLEHIFAIEKPCGSTMFKRLNDFSVSFAVFFFFIFISEIFVSPSVDTRLQRQRKDDGHEKRAKVATSFVLEKTTCKLSSAQEKCFQVNWIFNVRPTKALFFAATAEN